MPELLITRVQDVKVLESTVKELNDECDDVIAKAPNIVINNMDFNLAKKAATKRIKQAVAEPIMAKLNSFRPDLTRYHKA